MDPFRPKGKGRKNKDEDGDDDAGKPKTEENRGKGDPTKPASEDSNKRKQGGQKGQGESATSVQNAVCEKYPPGAVFLRLQRVQESTPFAPKFRTAQDSAPCHPFYPVQGALRQVRQGKSKPPFQMDIAQVTVPILRLLSGRCPPSWDVRIGHFWIS